MFLPVAGLLLIVGGAILLFREGTDLNLFQGDNPCLLTVPSADGFYVLDQDMQFQRYRKASCAPGPVLRTGEGDYRQTLEVPEFREFLNQWRRAVQLYPDLPGKLSEIRLSRTRDTIFFSRNGKLRIDVAHREDRYWIHTLHAVLVTAEAKGWTEGFIDLKNEDGLFIRSGTPGGL